MKKSLMFVTALFCVTSAAFAETGFEGRPITKNIRMETGHTLNKGEIMVGLGPIAIGLSDRVQLGTSLLFYIFQYYNADLKVNLLDLDSTAIAVGIQWGYFNLEVFGADEPFTTVAPYLAFTQRVGEQTNLHLTGQFSFFGGEEDVANAEANFTSTGTSVFAGLEMGLSNRTHFLLESAYDITFEGFRMGGAILFGWEMFRLKLGVSYYKPESLDTPITWPIITLWWRFRA